MGGFKKTNVGTAMEQAIDEAVAFIVTQVPSLHWSGNVILVKGTQVYINRGTREGVANGQVFQVGTSEILRDPATGETLDVAFTAEGPDQGRQREGEDLHLHHHRRGRRDRERDGRRAAYALTFLGFFSLKRNGASAPSCEAGKRPVTRTPSSRCSCSWTLPMAWSLATMS